MRFSVHVDIDRGIDAVWAAFVDRSLQRTWQSTLRGERAISGRPGDLNAACELIYGEGGRDVVVTETIIARREPDLVVQRLDAAMMTSTMRNTFAPLGPSQTRWTVDCEIRFRGLWAVLAIVGRPMLRHKTRADMERFRDLVLRHR